MAVEATIYEWGISSWLVVVFLVCSTCMHPFFIAKLMPGDGDDGGDAGQHHHDDDDDDAGKPYS